jgi:hypothetical protein
MKRFIFLSIALLSCVFMTANGTESTTSSVYTTHEASSAYQPVEREYILVNYLFTLETERIFYEKYGLRYWSASIFDDDLQYYGSHYNYYITNKLGSVMTLLYLVESDRCNEIVDSLLLLHGVNSVKILKTGELRKSSDTGEVEPSKNDVVESDVDIEYDPAFKRLTISSAGIVSSETISEYASDVEEIIFSEGVTGLSDRSFIELPNLRYVKFPSTLYHFGDYVFSDCKNLAIVDFPEYVESGENLFSIGNYAFQNCSSLDSLYIPSTNFAVYIWKNAFTNCTSLRSVRFGSAYVNFLGYGGLTESAFYGCTSVTNLYIDDFSKWVTDIPARNGCNDLLKVVDNIYIEGKNTTSEFIIPYGVEGIKDACFQYYNKQYSVVLPSTVERIGQDAFMDEPSSHFPHDRLRSINIPKSLKLIGISAFEDCNKIETIDIEDLSSWLNLKMEKTNLIIENWPYSNPMYVSNASLLLNGKPLSGRIVVPDNVSHINEHAFKGCTEITELVLPSSVKTLEPGSFTGSYGTLIVEMAQFDLRSLSESNITAIYFSPETELINTPYGCEKLTTIVLPHTLQRIDRSLLREFGLLDNIVIPESVKSIGRRAFYNQRNLSELVIPESVEQIEEYAFIGCTNLKKVVIKSDALSIGKNAFAECPNIEEVYVLSENVPQTEIDLSFNFRPFATGSADGASPRGVLYVPTGCKHLYPECITMDFTDVIEMDMSSMITGVRPVVVPSEQSVYYDLFGRRVENPQSGLYIKDGKKVFVK